MSNLIEYTFKCEIYSNAEHDASRFEYSLKIDLSDYKKVVFIAASAVGKEYLWMFETRDFLLEFIGEFDEIFILETVAPIDSKKINKMGDRELELVLAKYLNDRFDIKRVRIANIFDVLGESERSTDFALVAYNELSKKSFWRRYE